MTTVGSPTRSSLGTYGAVRRAAAFALVVFAIAGAPLIPPAQAASPVTAEVTAPVGRPGIAAPARQAISAPTNSGEVASTVAVTAASVGDPVPVSDPIMEVARSGRSSPLLASDGTVNLAVWTDARSDPNERLILASRIDDSGAVLDPGGIPVENGAVSVYGLAVGANTGADGTFLVVWGKARYGGDGPADLVARRIKPDGTLLDPTPIVITTDTADHLAPTVAWDGTRFVVGWYETDGIHAARIATDGTLEREPALVVAVPGGFNPQLAILGSKLAIAFAVKRSADVTQIRLVLADPETLVPAEPAGTLVASTSTWFGFRMAANASGAVVTWRPVEPAEIRVARIGPDGGVANPDGTVIGAGTDPIAAPLGDGFLVAWIDDTNLAACGVTATILAEDGATSATASSFVRF